jgi:hypothetical protein
VSSFEGQFLMSRTAERRSLPQYDCQVTIYKTKLLLFSAAFNTPSIFFL